MKWLFILLALLSYGFFFTGTTTAPVAQEDGILLETSDDLLLETGDRFLIE